MAFDLPYWANMAAILSAMADAITLGKSYADAYASRLRDPNLNDKAQALSFAFSTYSDNEVRSIEERLKNCRDRFIREGSGAQRRACVCSVFQDVQDGNGGDLPIEEWVQAYVQLQCVALKEVKAQYA